MGSRARVCASARTQAYTHAHTQMHICSAFQSRPAMLAICLQCLSKPSRNACKNYAPGTHEVARSVATLWLHVCEGAFLSACLPVCACKRFGVHTMRRGIKLSVVAVNNIVFTRRARYHQTDCGRASPTACTNTTGNKEVTRFGLDGIYLNCQRHIQCS